MERSNGLEARFREWPAPTWQLGLVVLIAGWSTGFAAPIGGLDPSWSAGLFMAVDRGMQFGTEVIFTYGPLGFLKTPYLWYDGLASLAFIYTALMAFAFSCALIWTLRSRVGAPLACLIAFLAQALLLIDPALGLAVLWGFALLSRRPPANALTLLISAGAVFAAAEALMKLSTGPVIFVVLLLALIGARAGARQIAIFLGTFVASFLALWLITGQSIANIPDFAINTIEIVVGYNEAMAMYWYSQWVAIPMILGVAAAVAWSWLGGDYRDRRARIAATAMVLVTGLAMYKQGVVRMEGTHAAICFGALLVVWAAIPTVRRWNYVLLAGLAAFTLISINELKPNYDRLNVFNNVDKAQYEIRTLLSPERKKQIIDDNRFVLYGYYALEKPILRDLEGKTVNISPWEVAAAWVYGLDWSPLPVFQNYSAYTTRLDRLNAAELESADGPERILRSSLQGTMLDNRNPAWDPPRQGIATLCNFQAGATSERWQVLHRVEDRCGPEQAAGEVTGEFGETIKVPEPGPGEVVFARIEGTEPRGLDRLVELLYRAPERTATISGYTYRLVPSTADDGLLLRSGKRVGDDDGLFSQVPDTRTIRIDGGSGEIEFDFYRMKVRPAEGADPGDR